jgi:hypothetical protein
MKPFLFLLLAQTIAAGLYAQLSNGLYIGLEKMSNLSPGQNARWYHENFLLVDNDSIFLYKSPIQIIKKRKIYSASDGGFYYYYGESARTDSGMIVRLTRHYCDYCAMPIRMDTAMGFMYPIAKTETYKIDGNADGFSMGKVIYHRSTTDVSRFPPRKYFYPDSNSIYRVDPKGQYQLISTGIKDFLATGSLRLDKDTLRVCLDRMRFDSIVETLDSSRIHLDSPGIVLRFYSRDGLKKVTERSTKPLRYVEVGEIIDYWKAARVSLTYIISLPKTIHDFSERQYAILLEYNKMGTRYIPAGDTTPSGWQLVEQK